MTSIERLLEALTTIHIRTATLVVAVGLGVILTAVLPALVRALPALASRRILRTLRARPVTRLEAPELFDVVERLCCSGKARKPEIVLILHDQVNLFALSGNRRAVLAVTRGALDGLGSAELEAATGAALARLEHPGLARSTVAAALGVLPSALAGMGMMESAELEESPLEWLPALFLVPFGAIVTRIVGGPVPGSELDLEGCLLSGRSAEGARVLEHMEFTAHAAPMPIPAALARLALVHPRGAPAPGSLVPLFPAPAAAAPRAALLRTAPSAPVTPHRPRPVGRAA